MTRLVAALFLFLSTAFAADTPNVLFVICDDLNCDLGSYGHPQVQSPNIDKLAERGVLFTNAHCQFAHCGPSRASFMTGLYPDQNGILKNRLYIRDYVPKAVTLTQVFRKKGYLATRIGKIYHYDVPLHIGTGGHDDPYSWDLTFNPRGRDVILQDEITTLSPGHYGATLSWMADGGTDAEQTDGMIADEAVRQLKKYAAEDESFFLAVGLFRPHTPYVAPKKYFDLYPLDSIEVPEVPENYLESIPEEAGRSIRKSKIQIDLEDTVARQVIQAYHAAISFADAQIGRILDALDETGLAENTVVVFTSDHGYHMGEHGHWQKRTLYENATRVPLIIASPDQKERGVTSRAPAEMVDIYPTLTELCGLKAPGYVSGTSLVPILNDVDVSVRESAITQLDERGYTIKTDRYRYTEWGGGGAGETELYDHESDPEELVNLAGRPEVAEIQDKLAKDFRARVEAVQTVSKGVARIK